MGNFEKKVEEPLEQVSGILIGENLLPAVKAEMLLQPVFQKLFGCKGERIFIDKLPSWNDTIVPGVEFRWKGERWQSQDTRVYGTIVGMIVLPADLEARTDRFRAIVSTFMRWIDSKHGLFTAVSGLIEFGTNADFKYDNAIRANGVLFPVIDFTLPVVFDLTIFKAENPEIDLDGALDAELFGWVETYDIRMRDDKGNVLIDTQILSKTGQTQDG
ncbi:MAG: hypothetical protein ACXWPM_00025 [Bdellovibrionota bacterium]